MFLFTMFSFITTLTALVLRLLHLLNSCISPKHNPQDPPRFVVIHPGPQPSVVTHRLPLAELPGAPSYAFFSQSHDRRTTRASASLQRLFDAITDSPPAIGPAGATARPGHADAVKDAEATETYTAARLRFPTGLASTQYLSTRALKLPPSNQPLALAINTGMCMSPRGVEDPSAPLTLYELEIITRLSAAIADIVVAAKRAVDPVVHIDIPDFQYYASACRQLQAGAISATQARARIDAVDQRRQRLGRVFTSLLASMVADRGRDPISVSLTPGNEAATDLVRSSISAGTVPALDDLVRALRESGRHAPLWRAFLHGLDRRQTPASVDDLGRLMYVFKSVRPALESEATLILHVDNVTEWKILDRARTFLKGSPAVAVGLFPLPRIFLAGHGRSDLYFGDLGECLMGERGKMRPVHVIAEAYGEGIARRLEGLCGREGLC